MFLRRWRVRACADDPFRTGVRTRVRTHVKKHGLFLRLRAVGDGDGVMQLKQSGGETSKKIEMVWFSAACLEPSPSLLFASPRVLSTLIALWVLLSFDIVHSASTRPATGTPSFYPLIDLALLRQLPSIAFCQLLLHLSTSNSTESMLISVH